MAIKVRCQQCGKTSQYASSDAGLTALCVACGSRFTVPTEAAEQINAEDVLPDDVVEVGDDGDESAAAAAARRLAQSVPVSGPQAAVSAPAAPSDPSGSTIGGLLDRVASLEPAPSDADTLNPVAVATPPPLAPPPVIPAGHGPNIPLLYGLLGSALTIAIVLAVAMILSVKPTWEQKNADAVRELKTKAEGLAVAKQFQQAYDAYRDMDKLVAGHEIRDPKLKADVERAHTDRDELFKVLFAKAKEESVAAADSNDPLNLANIQPTPMPEDKPRAANATVPSPQTADASWPEYKPKDLSTRPAPPSAGEKPAVVATAVQPPPPVVETTPATSKPQGPGPAANDNTPAVIKRPPITVTRRPAGAADAQPGVTDEAIGHAIQKGVDNLLARFADGKLNGGTNRNDSYYTGLNALCVYALLQSSLAIKDERLNLKGPLVRDLINKMKAMPADDGPATYARGIRATALALLNRPEDRVALAADARYLLESHMNGAYTYNARWKGMGRASSGDGGGFRGGGGHWDNSNSQYGLLGVWSAAEVGAEINSTYWTAVERHWTSCQGNDGAWDYVDARGGGGRISMTVAGVASLFVTHDYLDAPRMGAQVGREPFSKSLAKGLAYLETGDTSVNVSGGYTLYGLERVGLASGFKYFGDHDWYRELAGAVVRMQEADGSFGGEVETAYHLLFLARGRHPVLMNKLRFDGYWANRPRDVANLARFGSKELERPLNWQVVPITRDWTDWTDSPVLYIATHTPAKMSDAELAKIRSFVQAGGLLFTQADGGRPEADRWAEELARKLFPAYEIKDLPDTHEIFSILYKPSPRPRLRGVSNGARLLMVHSPTDISQNWQMRADKTRRSSFELGMNLFLYASGKADLRNRLASTIIPAPDAPASGGRVAVARLKYAGNWDPEPMAWTRFSRYFQRETDVALDLATVDFEKLDPKAAGFAHWTGTDAYTPTADQIAAMRKFVQAGGVLLVEPCGGAGEFYESTRIALAKAFPESAPRLLPKTHPILTSSGPGMDDLSAAQVRPYVKAKGLGTSGRLEFISSGKGYVVLNPLDLTEGLLAANTWGILGFEPTYAQQLAKNLVLWSASGMKGE